MALNPTTRSKLVSARELPKVVDAAVKAATARLGTTERPSPLVKRWELIGRVVRDRNLAERFAADVTAEVVKAGVPATSAVLIVNKQILAGFFEKPNLPALREF